MGQRSRNHSAERPKRCRKVAGQNSRPRIYGLIPIAIVVVIVGICAWRDSELLFRYPVATGLDGYYYVLQVDSLHNNGQLFYPSRTPVVFYILLFIKSVVGDTILAIKVGALLLNIVLCLAIATLVTVTSRSRFGGIAAAFISAASPVHIYFISEFIKNLGALVFVVLGALALVVGMRAKRLVRTVAIAAASILLIAGSLSHQSGIALVAASAFSAALLFLVVKTDASRRSRTLGLISILLLWFSPCFVALWPSSQVPAGIREAVSAWPHWPVTYVGLVEKLAILVLAPTVLILIWKRREEGVTRHLFLFGVVAIVALVLSANPFVNYSLGSEAVSGRFGNLAYLELAVLAGGITRMIRGDLSQALASTLLVAAAVAMLFTPHPEPLGTSDRYLHERANLIRELRANPSVIHPGSVVVAPHGTQYVLTAELSLTAQQTFPRQHGVDVVWLLDGIRVLRPSMTPLLRTTFGYSVIIRDLDLHRELRAMPINEYRSVLAHNAHIRDAL